MQITVLGSCGAWPEAGRACSGFLIEQDGYRLVADLGYATLPRLLAATPVATVDAVVVTHRHPDHCVDLHGLFRARHYHGGLPPLPVFAPAGVSERITSLEEPRAVADLRQVLAFTEFAPGDAWDAGPFRVRTWSLPHHVPDAGLRLTAGGKTVAYTGDTGPSPALAQLGRAADLYIVDATFQGEPPSREPRYLLTAGEAGQAAAAAGAKRLMLTHFWPGSDRARSVTEAAAYFGGPILVADEGLRLVVE